jgi:hypothetical protein
MSQDLEMLQAGEAPDLKELDRQIQSEVDAEFSYLSSEAKMAVVESKLKLFFNANRRHELIQIDLGENASKKTKDHLFG